MKTIKDLRTKTELRNTCDAYARHTKRLERALSVIHYWQSQPATGRGSIFFVESFRSHDGRHEVYHSASPPDVSILTGNDWADLLANNWGDPDNYSDGGGYAPPKMRKVLQRLFIKRDELKAVAS